MRCCTPFFAVVSGLCLTGMTVVAVAGGVDVLADPNQAAKDWRLVINRPQNVKADREFTSVNGEQVLRLTYEHGTGQNDYFRVAADAPKDAEGLEFDLKSLDVAGVGVLMVRLVDSTGQTWQYEGHIYAVNKWQSHRLAFNKSVFTSHWGGANDGEIHGSLKTIGIDFYRGPQSDPAQGTFLIRNLTWRGAKLPALPAEHTRINVDPQGKHLQRLRLDVGPHSPTQFIGSKYRGGMGFRCSSVKDEPLTASRIEYRYATDVDDYLMWTRSAPVPDAAGLEFSMRVSDNRRER